ncbi:kinase-like protein [Thelephora ganbajun]|uniref:Kinase-like protein n=1 Tax=Thelephora ganbajun TaxID=370292 RepID=A0ACB6ZBA9_THEGA|nr:kinase-like protein [Thelephora ganbajun]
MTSRRLYELDRSSAQFPVQLDQFLHDQEHVECIQNLPEEELAELINYLNDVLGQLDRVGQSFRKCFQVLQKICGLRAALPTSCQVSGAPSYTTETPVAFGGFCDVYRGTLGTGADICIKKIRICARDDIDEVKQSFCKEAVVWKHLSHPNIVPFIGVTLEPLQLMSEWVPGGELREYMRKNPNTNLIGLLLGVAEGLAYLHSCNVIHGDLKGPNIMVDESGNARITDFGLAVIARNPHSHRSTFDESGRTARWCAPEILRGGQFVGRESDVFSFGMVIIEVFTGKAPFGNDRTPAVIASIMTGKTPERPDHPGFTDDLWELTQRCLKEVPSDRPHVEEILAALKDMGRNRTVSPNQVNARPIQTHRSNKNEASSSIGPLLPGRTTGGHPSRQRRITGGTIPHAFWVAGIKPTESHGGPGEKRSVCVLDNVHSPKPGDQSVAYGSVKSPRTPHLHGWSNNTEKVSQGWHMSENHRAIAIPIQPQPQPRTSKKRGLWCRIKRFICCGQ